MNILFFQNIISPHQMPYIQHLPKMEGVDNVVVIVPEVNLGERDALGWDARRWLKTEGVKFVVAPTIEEVERLFNDNENSGAVRNGAMLLRNADATKRCRYEKEKSVIGYRLSVIDNGNVNGNGNGDSGAERNADATKRSRYENIAFGEEFKGSRSSREINENQESVCETQPSAISHQPSTVNQTWCLFSGINAFPTVSEWFRISLKYQVRRGVITEPPYIYDHPLWQHAIRFALKDWRYVKYIDKIFVMGDDYLDYYRFWSKRWEVIPFMYCTEWRERGDSGAVRNGAELLRNADATKRFRYEKEKSVIGYRLSVIDNGNVDVNGNQGSVIETQPSAISHQPSSANDNLKLLYVGALSKRKNVGCLLKACMLLSKEEQENLEIGIVGDGEQRDELERMSRNAIAKVHFYGTLPMGNIPAIMEQYDVLVLPSLHDGWGAVVNEALTLGLYVICSDHCGAKMLLKSTENGMVFLSDNDKDLASKISMCIQKREEIHGRVIQRIEWCRKHISGEAVANNFLSSLK